MHKNQIMIVEDEKIVALEIEDRLEFLGYKVCGKFDTGDEVIKKIDVFSPDLILMDIHLRGKMDGIDTAEYLMKEYNIPIIYLTAYADSETLSRAKLTQPYGYLLKPFNDNELYTAIETAMYRHRMEIKLKDNEQWLSTVLRSIGDGVIATDLNGTVKFINPVAELLTGWNSKEASGKSLNNILNVFDIKSGKKMQDLVEKVINIESGDLFQEMFLVSHNKRKIYIENRGTALRYEDNTVKGVVFVFTDISERKKAQEKIKFLKDFNEDIVQNMKEGIVVEDRNGILTFINPTTAELLGYSMDELVGQPWKKITSEDSYHLVNQAEKLRKNNKSSRYEIDLLRKDGKHLPVLVSGCPKYNNGEMVGSVAVFTDIRELKQVKQEIEKRQKYLESVLLNTPNAVITADKNHIIVEWNTGAEEMFGYSKEETIGKSVDDLITNPEVLDEARAITCNVFKKPEITRVEAVRCRKDGTPVNVILAVSPIKLGDELFGVVAVYTDITRIKKVEIELAEAKERTEKINDKLKEAIKRANLMASEAEIANKAKSEFLANMSHEIRTPMNGIIGMTELALETDLNVEQHKYLEGIKLSSDSLMIIINDILDFSKIEAGKLKLENIDFNLRRCLEDSIRTFRLHAGKKGLELILYISEDVPVSLIGDSGRVRQIVLNLLSNSMKFTDQGEIVLSVAVEELYKDGVMLHFKVRDTGIGISQEKQKNIFKSFTQADGSTTRKYGGSGLGLTISSNLVKMMDGKIWVENSVEKKKSKNDAPGSVFHFTACFKFSEEELEKTKESRIEILKDIPLLIVDDNAINRKIIKEMTSKWGMKPKAVESGRAALKEMKNFRNSGKNYSLALIDSLMPEMDGYSLVQEINSDPEFAGVSIMMLTSSNIIYDKIRMNELGIKALLQKPLWRSELLKNILEIFESADSEFKEKEIINIINEDGKMIKVPEKSLKILLVEDNKINRILAESLLKKKEFMVKSVENGKEALAALKQEYFDIILMDVQMPEMDGFEATREIRKQEETTGERIPIIAMTAFAMKGDMENCINAGMDRYISKPIKAVELFKIIEEIINSSSADEYDEADMSINISKAIDIVEGDMDLLKELVEEFLKIFPRQLDEIEKVIKDGDSVKLMEKAHCFKGAVANFGAETAYNLAYKLENLGEESILGNAEDIFRMLREEMSKVEAFFNTSEWQKRSGKRNFFEKSLWD